MYKVFLLAIIGLTLVGCVGPQHRWEPDTVYTEQSTYDFPNSTYHELGISGEITDTGGIRLDLFGVGGLSTLGDREHSLGGGFRLSIPIK